MGFLLAILRTVLIIVPFFCLRLVTPTHSVAPLPIIPVAVAPVTAPPKPMPVLAIEKPRPKKLLKRRARPVIDVEALLETEHDESLALNAVGPLQELASNGLDESELLPLPMAQAEDFEMDDLPIREVLSELIQETFPHLELSIQRHREEQLAMAGSVQSPVSVGEPIESEPVVSGKMPTPMPESTLDSEPVLMRAAPMSTTSSEPVAKRVVSALKSDDVTPSISEIVDEMSIQTTETQTDNPARLLASKIASLDPQVTTQTDSEPDYSNDNDQQELEGRLDGVIYVEDGVHKWIEMRKGHIELYLRPLQTVSDPNQDLIFLDYQYPNREFGLPIDTPLSGKYRLFAGIFGGESGARAVAEIPYPGVISADTYRQKIVFSVTDKAWSMAYSEKRSSIASKSGVSLMLTVFEGGVGNYRSPKRIAGATIKMIGFPERPTYSSDRNGSVRIPAVPENSEFAVDVEAPGYFPATYTVPVGVGGAYQQIYLVSRQMTELITRDFLQSPQRKDLGAIVGRIFDPNTHQPTKDERVRIASPMVGETTTYFNALPDPALSATTSLGLFAVYNALPSIRRLLRPEKRTFETLVKPGHVEYLELGRGGSKSFLGKLVDPFEEGSINASVRVAGDARSELEVEESGKFSIAQIDFPPGLVTLETRGENYPMTWHSLPWNPIDTGKRRELFLIREELLGESLRRSARQQADPQMGHLIGGAEAVFFEKETRCVRAELYDAFGSKVETTRGPYAFSGISFETTDTSRPLCLTSANPGFAYFNLAPGQYVLRLVSRQSVLRSHVVRIGANHLSVSVN